MNSAAIILAAGASKRFKSATVKQFVNICGKPVFLWSILAFKKIKEFKQIILVVPKNFENRLSVYKKKFKLEIVAGGKERIDSVRAGLNKLREDIEFVAIHDAARPLISKKSILNGLREARKSKAVVISVPSRDTVKSVQSKAWIQKTIPRNKVWLAQTPQIFHKSIILDAYKKIKSNNATDDAQLVELAGYKVKVVLGDYHNIKITEKSDLKIAEMLLNI